MGAPEGYSPEYCNKAHEGVDKDFDHLCRQITDVKDNVKTLNNRLWIGLVGIVINVVIVLFKFVLQGG
jgi:hypothetical protein